MDFKHSQPIDTPIVASAERVVPAGGLPQSADRYSKDLLLRHFPTLNLEVKVVSIGAGVDGPQLRKTSLRRS
ncbi:hypothetical protein SASPL_101092 [Salvia splendens]|uniref:Uncharacterized protein n=1 Tax=Salvia splendens TaxID=180675 RepID=A0A8X8YTC8_SALSN|nr:hypothetical protein SASPL_101092 [Salvia splendens]